MIDKTMPAEQTTATIEVAVGDDGPETTGVKTVPMVWVPPRWC